MEEEEAEEFKSFLIRFECKEHEIPEAGIKDDQIGSRIQNLRVIVDQRFVEFLKAGLEVLRRMFVGGKKGVVGTSMSKLMRNQLAIKEPRLGWAPIPI
ncbi:uncharacterized protein PGTG_16345 [Puccinia graminis f. sp. tritici CRL 75-36-700-3]|uniref:Uncharacterized protein n=1 Tax=Puccinia graminis f. sp. tritici (strain CRL 75-36-700-3 / race SCCL) TaxID=418459 RepID=E3L145_PUCGT|nr:uncharacterized protein PGTG_16345 [Puccinia graminis f. sp. tritici CRL 75-36-700-3]EFP90319.1 hypothetical protein PGTG_16345 [Puccinia graminis f. sp. tritici CRL 75-36-700-3]